MTVTGTAFQDLNPCLNAADAGFMLRQPAPANAVALPTQFAEYCLVGLPTIMIDAVPEACRLAAELGLWAHVDGERIAWARAFDRVAVARRAKSMLGKQTYAPIYEEPYRTIRTGAVRPLQ